MKKVSFDFDGTLSRVYVQEFAKKLIKKGLDVWICTSRLCPKKQPIKDWNNDLFEVAKELGIPKNKIIFTNYEFKYKYLDDDFIWHLDDDITELKKINKRKKVVGISVIGGSSWRNKCIRVLKNSI